MTIPDDDPFLLEMERRVRAVAEPAMRRERLLGLLETLEPDRSYAVLVSVLERPGEQAPHLQDLRLVMQDVLRAGGATRPLPSPLQEAWRTRARARAHPRAVRGETLPSPPHRPGPADRAAHPGRHRRAVACPPADRARSRAEGFFPGSAASLPIR